MLDRGNRFVRYYMPLPEDVPLQTKGLFFELAQWKYLEPYTGILVDKRNNGTVLTQKMITRQTGVSRASIGRHMSALESYNVIKTMDGKIYVNPLYATCAPDADIVCVAIPDENGKTTKRQILFSSSNGVSDTLIHMFKLDEVKKSLHLDDSEVPF